jgi:hypothetical protein
MLKARGGTADDLSEAFVRSNPADQPASSYKDGDGFTPIFNSVKRAEEQIQRDETSKSYLAIDGAPEYAMVVQELIFGGAHPFSADGLAVTAHTPGGTGGLRVAADFLKRANPEATVWVSQPTWPNHPNVFRSAGLRENPILASMPRPSPRLEEMEAALGDCRQAMSWSSTAVATTPPASISPAQCQDRRHRGGTPAPAPGGFRLPGAAEGIPGDAGGIRTCAGRDAKC